MGRSEGAIKSFTTEAYSLKNYLDTQKNESENL
jgi:hypothetical protein